MKATRVLLAICLVGVLLAGALRWYVHGRASARAEQVAEMRAQAQGLLQQANIIRIGHALLEVMIDVHDGRKPKRRDPIAHRVVQKLESVRSTSDAGESHSVPSVVDPTTILWEGETFHLWSEAEADAEFGVPIRKWWVVSPSSAPSSTYALSMDGFQVWRRNGPMRLHPTESSSGRTRYEVDPPIRDGEWQRMYFRGR